jgi:hypothetical protein
MTKFQELERKVKDAKLRVFTQKGRVKKALARLRYAALKIRLETMPIYAAEKQAAAQPQRRQK